MIPGGLEGLGLGLQVQGFIGPKSLVCLVLRVPLLALRTTKP